MKKMLPPKAPLEMLLPPIVDKLLTLMGRNGYGNVGLALVLHDLDASETAIAGNLNETGMSAILSSALNKVTATDETQH